MKNAKHLLRLAVTASLLPLFTPTWSGASERGAATSATIADHAPDSDEPADDRPPTPDPQRHFSAAIEALAQKHYEEAATEIRKAESFVLLEARRSSGDLRRTLEQASAELESFARALDDGTGHAMTAMTHTFANAEHALALSHQANAARGLTDKSLRLAGAELRAAAQGLKSSALWAGTELNGAVVKVDEESQALADKLSAGEHWSDSEVAKAFHALGSALDELGAAIGSRMKADKVSPSRVASES